MSQFRDRAVARLCSLVGHCKRTRLFSQTLIGSCNLGYGYTQQLPSPSLLFICGITEDSKRPMASDTTYLLMTVISMYEGQIILSYSGIIFKYHMKYTYRSYH